LGFGFPMKLEDTRAAYEALSAKASDIIRQLSLAGIAIIWLFKSGTSSSPLLDLGLLRAALFIFLALFFDFLQYLSGTTIWYAYFRYREKRGTTEKDEFLAPEQLNWPTWSLFFVKSALMLVAYAGYIIPFLFRKFVS
jgi:hypothetical protein